MNHHKQIKEQEAEDAQERQVRACHEGERGYVRDNGDGTITTNTERVQKRGALKIYSTHTLDQLLSPEEQARVEEIYDEIDSLVTPEFQEKIEEAMEDYVIHGGVTGRMRPDGSIDQEVFGS